MTDTQTGLIIAQVVTVLVQIGSFLALWFQKSRDRQWNREDRQLATAEIVATAKAEAEVTRIKHQSAVDALRADNEITAEQLRRAALTAAALLQQHQQQETAKLHAAIDGVKHEAQAAYREANDVNLKIASLGQQLIDGQGSSTAATIDQIQGLAAVQETSQQTQKIVQDIQKQQRKRTP